MATNARVFVDEIAAVLRSHGRDVTVSETSERFGRFVWMSAIAPNWYDKTITLSAGFNDRTGRWTLGPMLIDGTKRTGRTAIRISADVYA